MREDAEIRQLGDVAYLAGRIGWKGLTAKEYTAEGPLFLSVHGLNYGDYVDFRDAFHISQARYDESPEITLQKDDILICKDGAGIGKVGIIGELPGPATINSSLLLIRANEDVLPKYLYHALCSPLFQSVVQERIDGATTPHLYQREIRLLGVPLPSRSEQQRIVGILDEAFEGVATAKANAERNLNSARALFESELNAVFTRRGEGWEEKSLEDVLIVQPQNGWSPPAAHHSDSGTPVLTLSSVTGFEFKPGKVKFTSAATDARRHYWVRNGDLLITRSNTHELVGHVAIAAGIHQPTIYPDLIMRMNPKPADATPEFLYYQMRSTSLRRLITGRAQGANPTMKKISNAAVRSLPIAIPSLKVQAAVVEKLRALNEGAQHLASIYERKVGALSALKRTLLHDAYSGKL